MAPGDTGSGSPPEGRPPTHDPQNDALTPGSGTTGTAGGEPEAGKPTPAPTTVDRARSEDEGPEDTSGRPDLAEVAAERVDNRNTRVIETDVQEEV